MCVLRVSGATASPTRKCATAKICSSAGLRLIMGCEVWPCSQQRGARVAKAGAAAGIKSTPSAPKSLFSQNRSCAVLPRGAEIGDGGFPQHFSFASCVWIAPGI